MGPLPTECVSKLSTVTPVRPHSPSGWPAPCVSWRRGASRRPWPPPPPPPRAPIPGGPPALGRAARPLARGARPCLGPLLPEFLRLGNPAEFSSLYVTGCVPPRWLQNLGFLLPPPPTSGFVRSCVRGRTLDPGLGVVCVGSGWTQPSAGNRLFDEKKTVGGAC